MGVLTIPRLKSQYSELKASRARTGAQNCCIRYQHRAATALQGHDCRTDIGTDTPLAQMVFDPTLLGALSVPSAASAATAKYQVPLVRPVIS